MANEKYIKILKALSDETRFSIFEMLRGGTFCACKILEKLNITQPTLSHHMKVLCDCDLVLAEKDWKWTYYTLNCTLLNEFLAFMGETECNGKYKKENMCD